jgi:parvulin-like peptidyl-prolyl isomerase
VILYSAAATDVQNKLVVTADDVKAYYDKNADRYIQARLKVIYISFTASDKPLTDPSGKKVLSEAEAREKAEKLRKEILGGADFVKLAQLHSEDRISLQKDAEYGTIRKGDKLPNEIRNTVFALKVGEVSEPVRLPNGFYLFRAEESSRQPMEQVESELVTEIRQARFQEWLNNQRSAVKVTIENEAFFKPRAPARRQTPPTLGPKGVK